MDLRSKETKVFSNTNVRVSTGWDGVGALLKEEKYSPFTLMSLSYHFV